MDEFLSKYINQEKERQTNFIELIASENFVSDDIEEAVGSCLTNKYAEGYPEKESIAIFQKMFPDYIHTGNIGRYYGGCHNIDMIELRARYLFQKVFNTNYHVNVQSHSGSQANMAAYFSVLNQGDTILSMSLENGSHLSHGSSVNFSGKLFNVKFYTTDSNGYIDYNDVRKKALKYHPKLILAGASAYPRIIDFQKFKDIADEVGAYFMVDMAHIAGLVATGYHPSPFGIADIITTTTHKTLRGARGGLIFCKPELAKKVDSAIFPFTQGGGLQHIVAGKCESAYECLSPEYVTYIGNVVKNCKVMANEFIDMGYKLVTNGTDNHLFLLDFTGLNITGKEVQDACDRIGITLNKNCVPNETKSPQQTSGVRIGTAAMTTKGFEEEDFIRTAHTIDKVIKKLIKEKKNDY